MNKRMQNRALTVGAISALLLGIASAATARPEASLAPEALSPALAAPQTFSDEVLANALPKGIAEHVDGKSIRTIGTDENGTYLVGTSKDHREVCVLLKGGINKNVYGASCATTQNFHRSGAQLALDGKIVDGKVTVYMFPNDVNFESLKGNSASAKAPFSKISGSHSGIIVTKDDTALPAEAILPRKNTSGSSFQFERLSRPGVNSNPSTQK